ESAPLQIWAADRMLQNFEGRGCTAVLDFAAARPADGGDGVFENARVIEMHGFHLGIVAVVQCALANQARAHFEIALNSGDEFVAPSLVHAWSPQTGQAGSRFSATVRPVAARLS